MKNNYHALATLWGMLIIPMQLCTLPAVIFDLNGVLFTTDTRAILWHLGPNRLASYCTLYRKSPYYLKNKLYEILHALVPQQQPCVSVADDAGMPMPLLMQRWLMGTMDGHAILNEINTYLVHPSITHINPLEKDLIRSLAYIIFDPATFISTRSTIKEGLSFAQYCQQRGHQTYILSNWDADSFKLLYMQYKHIFDQFDGILISGTQRMMKPFPAFFQKLISLYDLNPVTCIFIDDQPENLATAVQLGINPILCTSIGYPLKKPDFKSVKHAYNTYLTALKPERTS